MTRASVRDRILKDVNSDINDHLRNHVHLTNCIHLKNHMHSKHSPILADRALVRDFIVLQRSRSLRDPSPSPSWHSPSVVDMLLKRGDLSSGRRSVNTRHQRKKLSESSPQVTGLHEASESAIGEVSRRNHGLTSGLSERGNRDGTHQHNRIAEKEESSKRFLEEGSVQVRSPELGSKSYYRNKGEYEKDSQLRTISDRKIDVIDESDDAAFSHNHGKGKIEKESEERGANNARGRVNRAKRRKFRGARRNRPSTASVAAETENEISVASNSYARSRYNQKSHVEKSTHDDHDITGVPRNGCGIPLNWSRIHDRGKSLLDMAGRSLSCGLSEPRFKRGGSTSKILDMPVMSEDSSESTRSEREAFPLLFDASGSQGSVGRASWLNNYSGELGIFADDLLKQDEIDSDLASEGRSHERHKLQRHNHRNKRHQSLTQKYTPKMFRDVVGQNLVVQALSNAIAKRKIGLLYVFYGPRGTGKTSCARVFSRALNCESLEYPKPCGFCNSCVSLDMGKSANVREIGPVSSSMGFEDIIELLESMKTLKHQSWYRVLIFDECDMLSSESWSAVLKIVDRAPRRVVFVLVCSSLDALPHVIISRCQKFFFPKLKEADIIYALQWISSKEDIEIDKDALKLIASKSDGSLRDAEMTLEQLSLIGKRISVGLVQELVGLISDEKLVDLLDLALSADTINTVKNLRDIMESGVEPLALMSQLATVITDILAGSYDFVKERPRMRFFKRQSLSKEDMEKLRQALKTLSEAEKQLRASSDRITWLTAALLQLAPDQQYVLPSSSAESFNNSPLGGGVNNNDYSIREIPRKSNVESSQQKDDKTNRIRPSSDSHRKIDDIWFEVLAQLPTDSLKEFMYQEAKLVSVSYGAAPTVQLLFKSHQSKSKAEKFRLHILQAFESVLRSPITIEIRCDSRKESGPGPILLPPHDVSDLENPVITHTKNRFPSASQDEDVNRRNQSRDNISAGVNIREIIELNDSPGEYKASRRKDESTRSRAISSKASDERKLSASLSLVRGKVSLARVIQDRYAQQHNGGGWSKNKAVSIAEKLEQENLRLEPRSRGLRCWNPPKFTRRKLSRLKIKTRKPQMLLKFMSCGKCLSARSPRQSSSFGM